MRHHKSVQTDSILFFFPLATGLLPSAIAIAIAASLTNGAGDLSLAVRAVVVHVLTTIHNEGKKGEGKEPA